MNASLRLSVSSLRAHKRRFAGTFLAVFLGVAFLAGTLVMGDTLRASFSSMFGDATAGTDAVVRSADTITTPGESQGVRQPVDTSLVPTIEKVPGVAAAVPQIEGRGQLVGADGKPVGGQGPPTLAGNWITDSRLNPYRIAEGRAPARSGEVVVNRGAAEKGGLRIGDTTTLRTPDPVEVTVVGLATFGGQDGMAQVTFTGMTRADAEKYLTAEPGQAASIQVRAGPGVSQARLVSELTSVLPKGVEAITGQESARENSLDHLGSDGIAITEEEAGRQHLAVGGTARLTFTDGTTQPFTVRAVYGRSELAGDYVITRAAWAPHRTQDSDTLVAVAFRPGVDPADGKAAVQRVAERFGNPSVQTRDEYAQSSAGGIDMMLSLVYALLALAVLIALLGIANTLTLAIHERTRELGLLRAVGQTRSQLRAMVRWESVLVAAFGTTGGLVLGAFLGWVLVEASGGASDTAFAFALPPVRLAVVALVGLAAGALAGLRPARRAARLDVLRAIAAE
ncbi:ABC transporter permease YtrF [Streptomyces sp. MBT84]|uniref:ABC transporter permease n=1 Tax=Streptomyces sp. MBT84 TaxID=1488414 RepID=UPI001C6E2E3D|nr:ABC transporter permease [Streptomyces sp. MBT84]MBW8699171.1 ABC transporter permease YtrF [Streptomyces sp. MBT84]